MTKNLCLFLDRNDGKKMGKITVGGMESDESWLVIVLGRAVDDE